MLTRLAYVFNAGVVIVGLWYLRQMWFGQSAAALITGMFNIVVLTRGRVEGPFRYLVFIVNTLAAINGLFGLGMAGGHILNPAVAVDPATGLRIGVPALCFALAGILTLIVFIRKGIAAG